MSDAWSLMQGFVLQADAAHARRDYGAVLDVSRSAMVWVPPLASGLFRFPVFDNVIRLAPVALDISALEYVQSAARGYSGLAPYEAEAESAIDLLPRVAGLYDSIRDEPGTMQSRIAAEWPFAASVLYCADAMGIVKRVKAGRTYALELLADHTRRPLR